MRRRSEIKLIFGILIWIGLVGVGILFSRDVIRDSTAAPMRVAKFLSTPHRQVELEFTPSQVLRVGAPIFLEQDGLVTPIGRVVRVNEVDSTTKKYVIAKRAFAELYSTAPELNEGDFLTFHETPESFDWVVEMMLPPETRDKLSELILAAYQAHQAEIVTAFRPIVENSLRDAAGIIQEDLEKSIANHEDELTRLGEKFQNDLVEKDILPLVQNEIWPIVQREAEPVAGIIGQKIWNEVSVWRFTWKYLYDRSPLPERNLAQKEFQRFVDSKAVPILEAHLNDLIKVQQNILIEISQNDRVKETVAKSIREVLADEEVQALVTAIFQEVFIDNPRLDEILRKHWNSPDAQYALAMTNARLEPTITMIGQTLFGSPRGQITPEFSRVLRRKILNKDDRWLMYRSGGGTTPVVPEATLALPVIKVLPGKTSTENPFHVPAE